VLACTVGVLTEVPVMLMLVRIITKTKDWYYKGWHSKPAVNN
jgi:ACR3 family arsenite transporter